MTVEQWGSSRGVGGGAQRSRRRRGERMLRGERESKLGLEVDPKVVIICTNLKHYKGGEEKIFRRIGGKQVAQFCRNNPGPKAYSYPSMKL